MSVARGSSVVCVVRLCLIAGVGLTSSIWDIACGEEGGAHGTADTTHEGCVTWKQRGAAGKCASVWMCFSRLAVLRCAVEVRGSV